MKRFTRIISVLLAMIMVAGLLPFAVFAEDAQDVHTVQFKLNYNGAKTVPSQKIADGECAEEPANATRTGWILTGWYTKKAGGEKFDFSTPITEDITLYAQWDENFTYWAPIWGSNIADTIESAKAAAEAEEEEEGSGESGGSDETPAEPVSNFVLSASDTLVMLDGSIDEIYFYLATDLDVETILLSDTLGNEVEMFDNGDVYNNGDDMMGDGIYSAVIRDLPEEDTVISYQAKSEAYNSNAVEVNFYTELTDEELMVIEEVDEEIIDLLNDKEYQAMETDAKKEAASDLLNNLAEDSMIVADSIVYNEEYKLFGFEYLDGILGGIMLEEFENSEFNGGAGGTEAVSEKVSFVVPSVSGGTEEIGTALILNSFPAFETTQSNIAFRTNFYVTTKNEWDDKGLTTTLKDSNVTVADYKTLDDYNVVCISTHGSTYSFVDANNNITSYPAICLAEQRTTSKDKLYEAERKDQQIVTVNGRYWILPKFIEKQYGATDFDDTFIFSECCMALGSNKGSASSSYNYTMSNAFTSQSAKAYVGFHNSVFAVYSREFMKDYVDQLIEGDTSSEAYQSAVSENGSNHEVWFNNTYSYTLEEYYEQYKNPTETFIPSLHVAYPRRLGIADAVLIETGLKNGEFELFDSTSTVTAPKYWIGEGDVRSLGQLGDAVPTDGSKRMAIITTGVGSASTTSILDGTAGTEGSYLAQKFIVPSDATKLTFNYNFISEEPMEYVGSIFNDAFGIRISQNGTAALDEILESINESTWTVINNIDFAGGDSTVYETTWKSVEIDVSACQGSTITLYFIIYDVGDSIYDSACVIDNVKLS